MVEAVEVAAFVGVVVVVGGVAVLNVTFTAEGTITQYTGWVCTNVALEEIIM